jgi:Contractile injection system tube protein
MSSFPNSPKLIKGGLVLVDADTAKVLSVISLQYNSDSLTRTLQVQTTGGQAGDRIEPVRFKGPAVETFKLEADIDATDQLEFPDQNPNAGQFGIAPQLAVLESLVQPSAAQLSAVDREASSGTLEIAPMLAPLAMFVWGKNRIVPVKVTDFSITEEAFDPSLNPIRAKVSLGLRVMSTDDLGFSTRGGSLFMAYLQSKEQLAKKVQSLSFAALGIGGIG